MRPNRLQIIALGLVLIAAGLVIVAASRAVYYEYELAVQVAGVIPLSCGVCIIGDALEQMS